MLQTVGQKHLHIGRPGKVHTVLQPQLFNACGRDSGEPYIKRSFLFASRPSDFTSRVEAPRSQHKPSQSFELEQHRSIAHPTGPKTNTDPRRSIKCSRRALDTHTHTLAQNCHCEFCCGMHLTCKNTSITPDRNGSAKRPEKLKKLPSP